MSMDRIFGISGGAMDAQVVRMNLAVSNIANAEVYSDSSESAYKAKRPIFETVLSGEVNKRRGEEVGGVRVTRIVEDDSTHPATYDPNHPKANEEGYVFSSNVNAMNELVEMTAAARSFESNVEAMNTAKQLMMRTVDLLKK
ncbi:MAG TPA: flagellar basal body rod protein FlgC [Gammaproteobacteria bacterium]|jgi:flagellar basal-body rod protein FlgC|nr:MAG: flagellar basal body rod protein FlgC [Gammaproteobacteria bacterium TMED134]HAL40947.1 flagellar basal body rod protein FlgC [Gammaproteobacteria bacterium]